MQRLGKFLLGFSILAACGRTLGGAPDAASSAGRGGKMRVDGGGIGSAGSPGVAGGAATGIGGAGGVGFLTGIGGAGGRGLGLGVGGDIGAGGDWVSPTGAGGGPRPARDAAPANGDAPDAASIDAGDPFCEIPGSLPAGVVNVVVTWCDAAQTCATCSWKTGGSIGGGGMPVGRCALPPFLCPPPTSTSSAIAAGGVFPVCTAHPDGETYEGVLVQLIGTTVVAPSVTVATSCSGLDDDGAGNLPVFGFDVTPCGLGRPTCVPDCTDCP